MCQESHIREPFMNDVHAWGLQSSYNCSFFVCLFKWHDQVISCSSWLWLYLLKLLSGKHLHFQRVYVMTHSLVACSLGISATIFWLSFSDLLVDLFSSIRQHLLNPLCLYSHKGKGDVFYNCVSISWNIIISDIQVIVAMCGVFDHITRSSSADAVCRALFITELQYSFLHLAKSSWQMSIKS